MVIFSLAVLPYKTAFFMSSPVVAITIPDAAEVYAYTPLKIVIV
jgi:hypothetical protein